MSLIEFIEGPLWWLAVAVFIAGVAWRIVGLLMIGKPKDLSRPRSSGAASSVCSSEARKPASCNDSPETFTATVEERVASTESDATAVTARSSSADSPAASIRVTKECGVSFASCAPCGRISASK